MKTPHPHSRFSHDASLGSQLRASRGKRREIRIGLCFAVAFIAVTLAGAVVAFR